ncbi:hypothetical protein HAX54_004639, partial [Datura stramonium]|nr:hypothetical protein [Datura stramonium]
MVRKCLVTTSHGMTHDKVVRAIVGICGKISTEWPMFLRRYGQHVTNGRIRVSTVVFVLGLNVVE